ncbi:YaiI/YqxD family protein [Massilibacterium senegalense]|uniref:YaiI/YqxD family protein n=1 Tax=Massilibacterium senegalense TaxID=1632858 RepID=UPI000783D81C|nr:DUF188 domain-containing protein [Massilibacterium senegalense]
MLEYNRTIFVDADSCPVKKEILYIAKKHNVPVIFIATYAHVMNEAIGTWIILDSFDQAVDLYILNHMKEHDIVVTQDFGLASIVLKKKGIAISPRGKQFEEKNIDVLLYERFLSMKMRKSGVRMKGMNRFSESDKQAFLRTLEKNLSIHEGI